MIFCVTIFSANLSGLSYLAVAGLLYGLWRHVGPNLLSFESENVACEAPSFGSATKPGQVQPRVFCSRNKTGSVPLPEVLKEEVGQRFVIERPEVDNVTAVLHAVDPSSKQVGKGGRTNLYFHVPGTEALEAGTYRIVHPRLEPFTARIERVEAGGREPDQAG